MQRKVSSFTQGSAWISIRTWPASALCAGHDALQLTGIHSRSDRGWIAGMRTFCRLAHLLCETVNTKLNNVGSTSFASRTTSHTVDLSCVHSLKLHRSNRSHCSHSLCASACVCIADLPFSSTQWLTEGLTSSNGRHDRGWLFWQHVDQRKLRDLVG